MAASVAKDVATSRVDVGAIPRSLPYVAAMPGLDIALVFEILGQTPRRAGDPSDFDAEYEPAATLGAIEAAFVGRGHRTRRIGDPHALFSAIAKGDLRVDAVLSIAEGYGTRNREAWAPVLCEMQAIPRIGSDALTLSLSLDKAWTRDVWSAARLPVAPGQIIAGRDGASSWPHGFPAFVKPRFEGTAKGIDVGARVEDEAALFARIDFVTASYGQPALVETFLPGAEYTVCVVGNDPPRVLPVLQRALDASTGIGVHALAGDRASILPGQLDALLERSIVELALRAYDALGCLDFARIDFKLDASGAPCLLEVNTLPTFAVDGSFAIVAELEGRPYAELLGEIFDDALVRLGLLTSRETTARRG